jgi:hypothetical protein
MSFVPWLLANQLFYLGFAIWQLRSLWLYADVGAVLVSEATICFVYIV